MGTNGLVRPAGELALRVQRPPGPPTIRNILRGCLPRPGLDPGVAAYRLRNLPNVWRGLWRLMAARLLGIQAAAGVLWAVHRTPDGQVHELGCISCRVVTTAGVGYIVDAFQNTVELENMKYHAYGTGTTAEATGDTGLVTELTTEYQTDNTRVTGSQTENGANVYRTVATIDPDADVALTEHAVMSQAATGGGVCLDRSKFAAINLTGAAGDTLQTTYDFTITAGG